MWAQVINMVLGLLIMVAPGIWNYNETAANNNYIVGPLVITFALVATTDVGRNVRWFNIPLGAWLIFSPLFLNFTAPVSINIIIGIMIIIFSLFKGKLSNRFGGGWRSLFQKNPLHIQEAENENTANTVNK